jgi:dTDP-4-dehydrorhamnose 3,5-epimerase
MNFIPTNALGCYSIEPKIIYDDRGYFMESFNERSFQNGIGQSVHFVQDNQSFSSKGVLRGLHFQTGEHAQAKLVSVSQGEVLDIAVDIRPGSATYGEKVSIVLSAEKKNQLFIPRGFAHGFVVLSETATFFYKCDNFYNKESEAGIFYNDPELNINWQFLDDEVLVSDKDKLLPTLQYAKKVW